MYRIIEIRYIEIRYIEFALALYPRAFYADTEHHTTFRIAAVAENRNRIE